MALAQISYRGSVTSSVIDSSNPILNYLYFLLADSFKTNIKTISIYENTVLLSQIGINWNFTV